MRKPLLDERFSPAGWGPGRRWGLLIMCSGLHLRPHPQTGPSGLTEGNPSTCLLSSQWLTGCNSSIAPVVPGQTKIGVMLDDSIQRFGGHDSGSH